MIKQDMVCFIKDNRAVFNNEIKQKGYKIYSPYIDKTIVGRVFRELWFRVLKLPESIWYNKDVLNSKCDYFFVSETLITKRYLEWLRDSLPTAKIIFQYGNLVGRARHILPRDIPNDIYAYTYDKDDSKKYQLCLYEKGFYPYGSSLKKNKKIYDVIFVGRDKGRAKNILNLQRKMENMGLNIKFLIMPNGRFYIPNKYYTKPISYESITSLLLQARAVLNISMPGQKGATIRDYESIFNGIKLITDNANIKKYDFFMPENVFILGERNLSDLPEFLNSPYIPVSEEILEQYTLENMIENVINDINIEGK